MGHTTAGCGVNGTDLVGCVPFCGECRLGPGPGSTLKKALCHTRPFGGTPDKYRWFKNLDPEENKLLYPDCELVIQGLLTLSFWNRNHNHSV